VGVLVPIDPDAKPSPPEALPLGRAALALALEGVDVVFGDRLDDVRLWGFRAAPGGWRRARGVAVCALYDRYPSQTNAEQYQALRRALGPLPLANDWAATRLCRDKLVCQRTLEALGEPMPEVVDDPHRFEAQLRIWQRGVLKPRYGSCGRGVRWVEPGDSLPARGEGMVTGRLEPMILQRAVSPPEDWAGVSLRVLVQRLPGGGWVACPPVARCSRTDAVVNVDRGAAALPAEDIVEPGALVDCRERALRVCAKLQAHIGSALLVEAGVDFVVDEAGRPQLIEVNSRPRGRLKALANASPERFAAAHLEACMRPIRYLAALFQHTQHDHPR
jgi:glutathione synthase/RimK-type ligase-like ATP-grasp enzyme